MIGTVWLIWIVASSSIKEHNYSHRDKRRKEIEDLTSMEKEHEQTKSSKGSQLDRRSRDKTKQDSFVTMGSNLRGRRKGKRLGI